MVSEARASRYREVEVRTGNPLQLVVVLYEGAIHFLQEAKGHLQSGDIEGRTRAINRTLAIVSELQATLNFEEGGQVARSLESLYAYMKGRLIAANLGQDDKLLSEVISLLSTLRSAWQELASLGLRTTESPVFPQQTATGVPGNSASNASPPGTVNLSC
jgi:flagellar protein FliS